MCIVKLIMSTNVDIERKFVRNRIYPAILIRFFLNKVIFVRVDELDEWDKDQWCIKYV